MNSRDMGYSYINITVKMCMLKMGIMKLAVFANINVSFIKNNIC